jgi:hypothetical protein
MDALVFFLVAVTVSSVLLYYSGKGPGAEIANHGQGSADPGEVLESLLHSSIGCDTMVNVDIPRHVSSRTGVDQCLLLEAQSILDGWPAHAFDPVNKAIWSILKNISAPVLEPSLSVWWLMDDRSELLIVIPESEPSSDQRFGASVELANTGEETQVVQLLLCPPAPSEIIDVLSCDPHLRAGVCASSAELYPSDGHHDEHEDECHV